jgi:hypothetical protein
MRVELGRLFGMKRKCDRTILPLRESHEWLPRDAPWYPEALELQPDDRALLLRLRREVGEYLGPAENLSDSDLLQFALQELLLALRSPRREDKALRLRFYLAEQRESDTRPDP